MKMANSTSLMFAFIRYLWIVLLIFVVMGGLAVEGLSMAGLIQPHCGDNANGVYPVCTPCGLEWSVFGVVEVTNCSKPFQYFGLQAISWARTAVVMAAIVFYPAVELLGKLWHPLPALVFVPVAAAILVRTAYHNFISKRLVERGIHRTSLASYLLLAIFAALRF